MMAEHHTTTQSQRLSVPVPTSISPEARKALARPLLTEVVFPDPSDGEGWVAFKRWSDESGIAWLNAAYSPEGLRQEATELGGVPVYKAALDEVPAGTRRVFLDFRASGLWFMGGANCALPARRMARIVAFAPVLSVDYRLLPDHVYPAPVDDGLAAYRALLMTYEPHEIVVGGESAGAGIAASVLLRARKEGLPLPAAAVMLSPGVDLTESGDSFGLLKPIMGFTSMHKPFVHYAGGRPLDDPDLSPLFADFSKGSPRLFFKQGRDMYLSNTVRLHRALRRADVRAELHVFEAMPHAGFGGGTPEDEDMALERQKFLRRVWASVP